MMAKSTVGAVWETAAELKRKAESVHGRPFSLTLTLPPLGALFLKGPM